MEADFHFHGSSWKLFENASMEATSLLPRRFLRGSAFLHGKYVTSMEAQLPSTSTEIMRTSSVEADIMTSMEAR